MCRNRALKVDVKVLYIICQTGLATGQRAELHEVPDPRPAERNTATPPGSLS